MTAAARKFRRARRAWCLTLLACGGGIFAIAYSGWSFADCPGPVRSSSDISYAKMRPPKYPPEAITARAEGKVLLRVVVEPNGAPSSVAVERTSGNDYLDRAAADAVSSWRFNPARCDGKLVQSIALVPVQFDLSEAPPLEPIDTAVANRPTEAGVPVLSEVGREVAPDLRPMEFQSVARMLQFLRNDAIVRPIGIALPVTFAMTFSAFFSSREREAWDVRESSQGGWTAAEGGWTSIIRTTFRDSDRTTWELYSQLCNGDSDWCSLLLTNYLAAMKQAPPGIPPPSPVTSGSKKP